MASNWAFVFSFRCWSVQRVRNLHWLWPHGIFQSQTTTNWMELKIANLPVTFGRCGCFSYHSCNFNTSSRFNCGNFLYCSSALAIVIAILLQFLSMTVSIRIYKIWFGYEIGYESSSATTGIDRSLQPTTLLWPTIWDIVLAITERRIVTVTHYKCRNH